MKKQPLMILCQLCSIQLQKEVKFNAKNSPAVKKCVAPKKVIVKKRCKIQGGSKEMAKMVG